MQFGRRHYSVFGNLVYQYVRTTQTAKASTASASDICQPTTKHTHVYRLFITANT